MPFSTISLKLNRRRTLTIKPVKLTLAVKGISAIPVEGWSVLLMTDELKLLPDYVSANALFGSGGLQHNFPHPIFIPADHKFQIKIRNSEKTEKMITLGVEFFKEIK